MKQRSITGSEKEGDAAVLAVLMLGEHPSAKKAKEGNAVLPHTPDGRQCNLCNVRDDEVCPFARKRNEAAYTWWMKPPNPLSGKSQGHYCGCCGKYYNAVCKGVYDSIVKYEQYLAEDVDTRLPKHKAIIGVRKQLILDAGCSFSVFK